MRKPPAVITLVSMEKKDLALTEKVFGMLQTRYRGKFAFTLFPCFEMVEVHVHRIQEAKPITPQIEAEMYGYFCGAFEALQKVVPQEMTE